jgi:hypothetical protein
MKFMDLPPKSNGRFSFGSFGEEKYNIINLRQIAKKPITNEPAAISTLVCASWMSALGNSEILTVGWNLVSLPYKNQRRLLISLTRI